MTRTEKVVKGLEVHFDAKGCSCMQCPYFFDDTGVIQKWQYCTPKLMEDAIGLIEDMENTIRLLEEESDDSARTSGT